MQIDTAKEMRNSSSGNDYIWMTHVSELHSAAIVALPSAYESYTSYTDIPPCIMRRLMPLQLLVTSPRQSPAAFVHICRRTSSPCTWTVRLVWGCTAQVRRSALLWRRQSARASSHGTPSRTMRRCSASFLIIDALLQYAHCECLGTVRMHQSPAADAGRTDGNRSYRNAYAAS